MEDKIALVTGANGFIGKNLCGLLIEKGAKVATVPREVLSNPELLIEFFQDAQPDYIFHLAAYGNHSDQKDDWDEILSANTLKTYLMLKFSQDIDYEAFINISTSSVYGEKKEPMSENMVCDPESFYGATKLSAELLANQFAKEYGKPIVNVRPFSVYGPGEAEHRFIPTAIKAINEGKKLKLAPDAVHDWIYIEDLVDALFAIVDNIDKFSGKSVNVGTGKQTANKEVIDVLEMVSGKKADVVKMQERYNDKKSWSADTSLLDKYYSYETSLVGGLDKTYKWYSEPAREKTLTDAMNESLGMVGDFSSGFKEV